MAKVQTYTDDRITGSYGGWSVRVRRWGRRLYSANELALVGVLLVLALLIQARSGQFFTTDNLVDIARATSFLLIVAVAQTFVLVSGSLDLSVGSVYALGGVAAGLALAAGVPVLPAVLTGVAAGALVGAVNGLFVVRLRVPALIATLGTLYAARGLVYVLTGGAPVYDLPEAFTVLGRGEVLGLPVPVWIALAVLVAGHLCLSRTVFGRRVYALGSNERAAYLSGVPIARMRVILFMLCGGAAALGGVLVSARIASAQVNSGTALELTVIAAVVIGGTSLFGGTGGVLGTLLGALLITVINNGLVLTRVDPFYQNVVIGLIIVAAVAVDGWRRRRMAAG